MIPTESRPLAGLHVVSLAMNLPGPLACARLVALGAEVLRVEPPSGDLLAGAAPEWHRELVAAQQRQLLDLKQAGAGEVLHALLAEADLLVTSSRPAALERLGLGWDALHLRHPRLCQVAIVGHAHHGDPAHDLTCVASAGLTRPPALPPTLLADLATGDRAVAAALALLLARERGSAAGRSVVALADAAHDYAGPLRHGLTAPGGLLAGGSPLYGFYRASDGWIALAALEPRFAATLAHGLGLEALERGALEAAFAARPAGEWEAWGRALDLPLVAVREAGDPPSARR